MRVARGVSFAVVLIVAAVTQAEVDLVHFSSELDSKTGWTETQGGPNGYTAAGDPWGYEGGDGAHSSITTATSERQATVDTPVDIAVEGMTGFTYATRLMLHNYIAASNEAVGRAGMLTSGSDYAEGKLNQFWLTLRRIGAIELTVRRWTNDVGDWENIVNTSALVDTVDHGLSGYEYADFTVTRDPSGLWTVDAQNGYGETAVHFTAQESTVATSSALNTVYMQDLPNQWNGGETAIYYDNVSVTSTLTEGSGTWNVDSSGDWTDGMNYTTLVSPNGNTHSVTFGDAITSTRTVYTDTAVTVKTIEFDNANAYVIAGGGSVSMEADTGNAAITVVQGDHEFQTRVNLNSSTDVDVAASSTFVFNNALNLGGNTLTKTGGGTVAINNQLTTGGGSVVGVGGTITGSGRVGGNLTNTTATVAPGNSPGTLAVAGDFSQGAGGTLAIELAGTAEGEFDLLEVTGSTILGGTLDVTELYTPGGSDTWTILTAVGGITGSFDTITAGYEVALANGDTELVLSLSGALLPGDANGDGCVDDLDLTALAVHWQQSTTLWENGDFNGDGIVDDLDLTALAVNWQQGCGGGGSLADALAAVNVPEPVSVSLMLLALPLVIRRRS